MASIVCNLLQASSNSDGAFCTCVVCHCPSGTPGPELSSLSDAGQQVVHLLGDWLQHGRLKLKPVELNLASQGWQEHKAAFNGSQVR